MVRSWLAGHRGFDWREWKRRGLVAIACRVAIVVVLIVGHRTSLLRSWLNGRVSRGRLTAFLVVRVATSLSAEAVRHTWDARIVGCVRIVTDAVRANRPIRVGVSAICHGVGIVEVVVHCDGAWSDGIWRLAEGMLREGSGVHGREPDAGLVDAVQLGNEVLEVDVVVGIVVEYELLKVPMSLVSTFV